MPVKMVLFCGALCHQDSKGANLLCVSQQLQKARRKLRQLGDDLICFELIIAVRDAND